jgi:DNA-binding transcriptional LysR family regulator
MPSNTNSTQQVSGAEVLIEHPCYVLRYMGVELAQWRLFLAVADEGSLGRAAVRLGTDQPALSRAVRRLELTLGTPLFIRSPTGTTLTAAGARLLEQARSLIAAADTLDAAASVERRGGTRALRVGVLDFHPFPAALAAAGRALLAREPPLHLDPIDLPWRAHTGAVLNRTVDAGFTLTVDRRLPAPDLLRSTPLRAATQAYALLPTGHPLAAAEVIDPRDLAEEPLHVPRDEGNQDIYDLALELLADNGVAAPRLAPTSVSLAAVMQHIAAGDGWTIVSDIVGRHPVPGITGCPLAIDSPREAREVLLEIIWHRNADALAVRALVDQLLQTPELTAAS